MPQSKFHIARLVRMSRPWINVDDAERLVGIGQSEQVIATTLVSRFSDEARVRTDGQQLTTVEEGVERILARKKAIFTQVIDGQPVMDNQTEQRLVTLAPEITGQISLPAVGQDMAMKAPGGIDLNSANLTLHVKRDGNGVPLPLVQQDLAQLSNIEGLDPVILSIKPASQTALFSQIVVQP